MCGGAAFSVAQHRFRHAIQCSLLTSWSGAIILSCSQAFKSINACHGIIGRPAGFERALAHVCGFYMRFLLAVRVPLAGALLGTVHCLNCHM